MRFDFRIVQKSKILRSTTVLDETEDTRTHKVFNALAKVCNQWDLAVPMWLDVNVKEFKARSGTRFTADSFVEDIAFDYLSIEVLEED